MALLFMSFFFVVSATQTLKGDVLVNRNKELVACCLGNH